MKKKQKGGGEIALPLPQRMQSVEISLDRTEVRIASEQELPWAKELAAEIRLADRWLSEAEEWAIVRHFPYARPPRTDSHCPSCYDQIRFHDLDRVIRCAKTYYKRRDCDHEWSYAGTGDDVCQKCGKVV